MTYNPDDIEQAKMDMREQAQLGPSASEVLADERRTARNVNDRRNFAQPFSANRKTELAGGYARYLLKKKVVFEATEVTTYIDEDGDPSQGVTYIPIQDAEIEHLLLTAKSCLYFDPNDRSRGKIEKYLDWGDEGGDLPDGAVLFHKFRNGREIFKSGGGYFISWDAHGEVSFYRVKKAHFEKTDFKPKDLQMAVDLAIEEDRAYAASQAAREKLRKMGGYEIW